MAESARLASVPWTLFFEPDLDGDLTAVALGPGDDAGRLVRRLPLLLGEGVNT